MPNQPWPPDLAEAEAVLLRAEVEEQALIASGSNYVFLLTLRDGAAGQGYAVYKPRRGEAPLGDFPEGTLYKREYASYLLDQALGWRLIPPTVIRDTGDLDHGVGMLQLFVHHDPAQHFFTLKEDHEEEMKRIALFDWLTNNADRKGGHCLLGRDGRIWCIDHGLTFHVHDKLRTVIWDYAGQPAPPARIEEVCALGEQISNDSDLRQSLHDLLSTEEIDALERRISRIDRERVFPQPPAYRPYPWPPV